MSIELLIGRMLTAVTKSDDDERITFEVANGPTYIMEHEQD